jgi:hypothetical protein
MANEPSSGTDEVMQLLVYLVPTSMFDDAI